MDESIDLVGEISRIDQWIKAANDAWLSKLGKNGNNKGKITFKDVVQLAMSNDRITKDIRPLGMIWDIKDRVMGFQKMPRTTRSYGPWNI